MPRLLGVRGHEVAPPKGRPTKGLRQKTPNLAAELGRTRQKLVFRLAPFAAAFAEMSGDTLTTSYQDAEEALSRAKLTAERTERVGAHVLGTLGDQRQQLLGAADGAAA